jgi:hypothetical protein
MSPFLRASGVHKRGDGRVSGAARNFARRFGSPRWMRKMVDAMGLAHTLRPRGRPRKRIAKTA